MADVDVEIDSFVGKFRQLWRAGLDVHLDLNAHAGNAWVGIKLNLGQPKSTQQQCEILKKRYSPSRIRRRERRAASRQDNNLTDTESVDILNKDGNKSKEIGKSSSSDSNQMAVVAEEANIEPTENLVTEEVFTTEDLPVRNSDAKEVIIDSKDEAQTVSSEQNCVSPDTSENIEVQVKCVAEDDVQIDTGSNDVAEFKQPAVAVIHATAIIQNSPYHSFSQDEWNSILRFITNKDHLKKNVTNVEYCQSSSKDQGNTCFMHSVLLKILVKTEPLWESPRSYLWKHVGQDTWERGNGSSIMLTKIH